jgi:preprotein translocase subunit SecD
MRNYRLLILILVIVAIAIWIVLPSNQGIHVGSIQKNIKTRLGLDLVGGVQALLEADLPPGTPVDATKMQTAATIVENRVNGLGVTEALVQQAGDRRIVVELPGVSNPEEAIKTIQKTGLLEFVDMGSNPLSEGQIVVTDFGQTSSSQVSPTQTPGAEGTATSPTPVAEQVLHTVMTGSAIDTVQVVRNTAGEYEVSFKLTADGSTAFADFTSNNIGKYLGIVLDKKVISVPVVKSAITQGEGVIQGGFTQESANALAIQLRYGSLPIPLKVASSQLVGPTLGEDSLNKSLIAGVIGLSVVILFMMLYYRLPGVLASIALLIYAVIVFALYKLYPLP